MVVDAIVPALQNAFFAFSFADALTWSSAGLALSVYTILIFLFYRFVATRDIFSHKVSFSHPGVVGFFEDAILGVLRFVQYGVLFPIISFLWFIGFTVLLFLIVQNQSIQQITLISIAVIVGARVLSYLNQDAAQELAKVIPMVILGAALIEPNFFQFEQLQSRFVALPALSVTLLQFVVYLSGLEMGLRFFYHLKMAVFDDKLGTREKEKK